MCTQGSTMTSRFPSSRRRWAGTGLIAGLLLSGCGVPDAVTAPATDGSTSDAAGAAPDHAAIATPMAVAPTEGRTMFVCPMHPQIQQDAPGTCPLCGMNLVERRPAATPTIAASSRVPLAIDAGRLQRLGVRLSPVERGALQPRARAAGEVIALPGDLVEVQARTAGWVERLHVRQIGIAVEAGTVLAELYLPDVERVRAELALDADLAAGSAERLRRLGVAPRDLEALRDGQLGRRVPLRAPQSGVVAAITVATGAAIAPGQTLFRIEPRDRHWIEARLPVGTADAFGSIVASARLTVPGRTETVPLDGPWTRSERVDADTQTVAWRTPLPAAAEGLVVGRYVAVELSAAPRATQWLVPRSAVLRHAGNDRLVVRDAEGQLTLHRVRVGATDGQRVEVLEGVGAGDAVVTRSAFLIDAEAEIDGLLADWSEAPTAHAGHDHD